MKTFHKGEIIFRMHTECGNCVPGQFYKVLDTVNYYAKYGRSAEHMKVMKLTGTNRGVITSSTAMRYYRLAKRREIEVLKGLCPELLGELKQAEREEKEMATITTATSNLFTTYYSTGAATFPYKDGPFKSKKEPEPEKVKPTRLQARLQKEVDSWLSGVEVLDGRVRLTGRLAIGHA